MDSSEKPSHTGDPPHPPAGGTFFGLNRNQLHSWGVGAPRDYKARYPPDPHGKGMSSNARIWSIYLDEAADFDANMLAEWRDTIDVLLVFAGLFSAVLTTFVVQTSQSMQPDYNQASMQLLFEILKATASNDSQITIPSSPTDFFSPSLSDEWTNSLWFVSLTLSLITALVAVLVKQWIHQYVAIVSDSSARDRARIRHMRYTGLQTWRVPMIIGLLPVLLHVSLALFFAGLTIFLFSLGMKVAWLVSIIGAATYTAYVIALILPLIHPYCPYQVPLTLYIYRLYQYIHRLHQLLQYGNGYLIRRVGYCIRFMRHYTHVFVRYCRCDLDEDEHYRWLERERQKRQEQQTREGSIPFPQKFPTLKEIEHNHIQQYAATADLQSLLWLHSSSSNASVHQSVAQAASGMTFDTLKNLSDKYVSVFLKSLHQQIELVKSLPLSLGTDGELDQLNQALSVLYAHSMDERIDGQLIKLLCSIRLEPV